MSEAFLEFEKCLTLAIFARASGNFSLRSKNALDKEQRDTVCLAEIMPYRDVP